MAVSQETFPVVILAAESDALTGVVNVNYLHWYSPDAVAGDYLVVTDADDNVIWNEVADGAYCSKMYVLKHPINGLQVATMDSGELHVIKEPPQGFKA